jgi:hypothetical protein
VGGITARGPEHSDRDEGGKEPWESSLEVL